MIAALIALLVCLVAVPAHAEPAATDWPYSCVARIQAGNRGGSATLVGMSGTRGLVSSAGHVVGNAKTVKLTFPDGYQCEGRVLDVDRAIDIAAIECQVPATYRTPRRVRAARESDGTLVAVGYPSYSRAKPCWTSGTFAGYSGNKVMVKMRRPIFSGYSGGMLIAPDGSYCGVTNWAARGETLAASGQAMETFIGRWMPTGAK